MKLQGFVTYHIAQALPLPPVTTLMDYVLAGNGVFKRAANHHLTATIPIAAAQIYGLAHVAPEVRLNYPPVSEAMLQIILAEARRAALASGGPREVLFQLCWRKGEMVLVQPPQEATAIGVRYEDIGLDVVADIHSHHVMAAEFSAQDDTDEQGLRLYGVIGDVLGQPAFRLRMGVEGDFWILPMTTLFAEPGPFVDLCPGLNLGDTPAAWPHSLCDSSCDLSANRAG